jgi:hypothetical protein
VVVLGIRIDDSDFSYCVGAFVVHDDAHVRLIHDFFCYSRCYVPMVIFAVNVNPCSPPGYFCREYDNWKTVSDRSGKSVCLL